MGSGLLESIIRDLPGVAVLALDRDLRLTFAGGAGLGAHGWDAERLPGRDVRDLLPARAARLIAPHHAAALAGAVSEFEFASADGARTSALEIAPLVERGETVGSIAVVRDITETVRCRERAALEVDDSRREFKEAAQGMVIGSLTGTIVDVNTSFVRTLGYEHHELLGRSWSDITHPEDRERDHRRVMAIAAQDPPGDPEADTYRTEKRYLRRDGG